MQASGNFHCDEHNRTAEQKTELHRTTMTWTRRSVSSIIKLSQTKGTDLTAHGKEQHGTSVKSNHDRSLLPVEPGGRAGRKEQQHTQS